MFLKKTLSIFLLSGILAAMTVARAADIVGTITFKGRPAAEIPLTAMESNADCMAMHTNTSTTHHYVVGPNGGRGGQGRQRDDEFYLRNQIKN